MNNLSLKLVHYLRITSQLNRREKRQSILSRQFITFLLVGAFNTAIGLSMMLFLKNGLNWPYGLSTFTGNTLGAVASFFLNRTLTFSSSIPFSKGSLRFGLVILASYLLSYSSSAAIMNYFDELAILEEALPWETLAIIVGSGLYTVVNYFGQKYLVFHDRI